MEELNRTVREVHRLSLDGRKNCLLTGVKDVINFDDREVQLETGQGNLTIKGSGLHVTGLSLERGEVTIDGMIDSMVYSDSQNLKTRGESVFGRLFR